MEQEQNKDIQEIRIAPKTKKQTKKFFLFVIVIVIAFYVGVAWGKGITEQKSETSQKTANFIKNLSDPTDIFSNADKDKPEEVDFSIFWDAWVRIDKRYIDKDKLDPQARMYGAISGMVGALEDPYSGFMDPEETKDFGTDMEGSFEGIGAELGMKDGILTIIAPIEGMPAEKAGLRAGDKIIKINDDITSDITIDKAVKKIRGKKGTDVSLTILRGDEAVTREITITRGRIEIKSAIYEKKDGGIAYIKIKKFADDTSKEFNKAVSLAIADNTKGIVLDLRNNPGGFLNISVDIVSKFVPKGEVVVWEQKGDGSKTSYKARGGGSLSDMPMVILINEGSASASEIVAGALRDINQTILIGKKSFGKGSVQQLESLRDGSSLRITIAKWLTPLEKSIHEVGLEPDIEVGLTNEDFENKRDPQYDRAMEEIKKLIQ